MTPRVHGPEAMVVGYLFEPDAEALPLVFECPQPKCPVIMTTQGLRVARVGHVTCQRCLRPMHQLAATVH